MGLEPKIVHFRARQLPRPKLPFLVTQPVDVVAEIARDRISAARSDLRPELLMTDSQHPGAAATAMATTADALRGTER